MSMLRFIPLFVVILIVYNVLALSGMADFSNHATPLVSMGLISGATLEIYSSTLLLIVSMFTLYIEILKSTKTSVSTIIDHTLSMLVFVVFIVEFLVVEACGNATFLLLILLSLLDVIAGFTITISTAKRDLTVGDPGLIS